MKKDQLAFLANMRYLLNAIGEYDSSKEKWAVETLGGTLDVRLFENMGYSVYSRFRDTPGDAIPKWLYSPRSFKCNWHSPEVTPEDIAHRGWIDPFMNVANNLALMVKGEGDAEKAIAKFGLLEDLLPQKGHVQFSSKDGERCKLTVAAFKKTYRQYLCDHARLNFDNTIEMAFAPASVFRERQLLDISPLD